jgi:hypothetical protein
MGARVEVRAGPEQDEIRSGFGPFAQVDRILPTDLRSSWSRPTKR